ncbi:hypothetical protein CQ020_17315 [Arthrobacter sp. MYb23]|uniref:hypothetical protein n=1 Tax=unclassified Arthrobacter TaxID=235627 RepID=UPI000CFBC375|nr:MULTISPECIES: hypothetical protein [unclassified Arthrobacter]PRB41830.1 hypothetical protein CQ038_11915 [Arthrobacter sp. MYb51]PRB93549.1 hypothetical protein CQ020_17315 [Arthrobacter sp. MYb23]
MTDRKGVIILDQLSPKVLDRVLEEAEAYRGRLLKRTLAHLLVSIVVGLFVWIASLNLDLSDTPILRRIPGASVLSGFGLLATLVVAVQIQARSLKITDKRKHPGPVEFLDMACRVISLAATGLMILSFGQSFDFSSWPNPPRFDALRGLGSLALGGLLSLFASDAAEHSQLVDTQADAYLRKLVREKKSVLKALPRRRFGAPRRPTCHIVLMFAIYPVSSGIVAASLAGGKAFIPTVLITAGLAYLAVDRLSKICVLWYNKQWWSVTGSVAMGVLLWVIFTSPFVVAALEVAAGGRWGVKAVDILGGLFQFLAFYMVLTAFPFYAGAWMCCSSGRGRGLVLEVAVRKTLRQLLALRRRTPLHMGAASRARPIGGPFMRILSGMRRRAPMVALAAIGVVFVLGVSWLVVFGPGAVSKLFPGQ